MASCLCEQWDSRIDACKRFIPNCNCCESNKVRICLYPGEYENSKLNKDYLVIIKEGQSGSKIVTCTRLCKANDLKPLDCKSYPFFPYFDDEGKLQLKRSTKCPLSKEDLKKHRKKTLACWKELIKDKKIVEWIKTADLGGYKYVVE